MEKCVDFIINSTNDATVNVMDSRVTRLFDEYDKDKDVNFQEKSF